jgi:hypothetical protein
MNPYLILAQQADGEEVKQFVRELGAWHDEMVLHQRLVRRFGATAACSDSCPHVAGRRLWNQATELLGTKAQQLAFLRSCASK